MRNLQNYSVKTTKFKVQNKKAEKKQELDNMEKLCKDVLEELRIEEVEESQECSEIFSSASDSEDSI